MDLAGKVNFPKNNVASTLKISIGDDKIIPIKVKISGKIDKLSYTADKFSVLGNFMENTLENIRKTAKEPKRLVKNVISSLIN